LEKRKRGHIHKLPPIIPGPVKLRTSNLASIFRGSIRI